MATGLGTVYATTVTYPFKGDGYNIVLIDCDEGFRLMGRVEEIDPLAVRTTVCGSSSASIPAERRASRPIRSSPRWRRR